QRCPVVRNEGQLAINTRIDCALAIADQRLKTAAPRPSARCSRSVKEARKKNPAVDGRAREALAGSARGLRISMPYSAATASCALGLAAGLSAAEANES